MRNRMPAVARRSLAVTAALAAALLLAGCVGDTTTPAPAPTTTSTAAATPAPTPTPLALVPDGTASENLEFFASVVRATLDAKPDAGGRAIVDSLVAAGFDKAAMEVTPDRTAVDLEADNNQFSVRTSDGCIVGQSGNVGFQSFVAAELATGTCLVGHTRAIDW